MASTLTSNPTRTSVPLLLALSLAGGTCIAQGDKDARIIERAVFRAFPEADAYKCIQRDVTESARLRIEKRLPFKVHFDELGEHCLIVAFRGRRPVGLVYRRMEEADGGLAEIAWHMTLDLRVVGFEFLRGRNRHIRALERSKFERDLAGMNLTKVIKQVHIHDALKHEGRNKGIVSIERMTLRSAAKALVVTETTWHEQVEKLHDQATGFDLFPAAARFTRRTGTVDLTTKTETQVVEVEILYAYDIGNTLLGCVVWSESARRDDRMSLRWVVDRDMRALGVTPTTNTRDIKLRKACREMAGRPLASPPNPGSELGKLARGLATVVQNNKRPRRRQ